VDMCPLRPVGIGVDEHTLPVNGVGSVELRHVVSPGDFPTGRPRVREDE
jgi:hypothetical protein